MNVMKRRILTVIAVMLGLCLAFEAGRYCQRADAGKRVPDARAEAERYQREVMEMNRQALVQARAQIDEARAYNKKQMDEFNREMEMRRVEMKERAVKIAPTPLAEDSTSENLARIAEAQERQARAAEDVADQLYRAQHPDFDRYDLNSRIAVGSIEDFKKLSGHGKPSSK